MYRGREAWVRGVNTLRGRLRRPRICLSPVTRDQRTLPQADYDIRHQREIMFRYRIGGIHGNTVSLRHTDEPNLARAPPFINDRLPELASNSRREPPIQINRMFL